MYTISLSSLHIYLGLVELVNGLNPPRRLNGLKIYSNANAPATAPKKGPTQNIQCCLNLYSNVDTKADPKALAGFRLPSHDIRQPAYATPTMIGFGLLVVTPIKGDG